MMAQEKWHGQNQKQMEKPLVPFLNLVLFLKKIATL